MRSAEADIFPRNHPQLADLIDGSIGEGSPFHELYGYYAQGVSETTAILPADWHARLVRVSNANTAGVVGLCLEVHDLAISKYVAGREKDREFTAELAKHGMIKEQVLVERLARTNVGAELRKIIAARIRRDFAVPVRD